MSDRGRISGQKQEKIAKTSRFQSKRVTFDT